MTVSQWGWGGGIRVDGLTIADELVVLHTLPRAKNDYSMGNVGRSAAVGALADLVMAGRVGIREVDTNDLNWWRRKFGQNKEAHRLRLFVESSTPIGEEFLDSVLQEVPGMKSRDLPWCINHMEKMWRDVLRRLYDRRVKIRREKNSSNSDDGVDRGVEEAVQRRLRQALLGPEAPDAHTAAVVLLGHAGELFKPGSRERELVGPIDDAAIAEQIKKLAALPSLAQVQILARASVQVRNEEQASKARGEDALFRQSWS